MLPDYHNHLLLIHRIYVYGLTLKFNYYERFYIGEINEFLGWLLLVFVEIMYGVIENRGGGHGSYSIVFLICG